MIRPYQYQDQGGKSAQAPCPSKDEDCVEGPKVISVVIIALLFLLLLIFCAYMYGLSLKYYYRNELRNRQQQQQNQSSNNNPTTGLSLQVIQENLAVCEYKDDENATTTSSCSSHKSSSSNSNASSLSVPSPQDELADISLSKDENVTSVALGKNETDDDLHCCAICFNPLCGKCVCHSNNPACRHVFHETCMVTWLRKLNECPVCRQTYLIIQESV